MSPSRTVRLIKREVFIVEPRFECVVAVPRGGNEDRTEIDPGEVQPSLEGVDWAALFLGAAADLDFAPTAICIEGEKSTLLQDLDPSVTVWRVVLTHIEGHDF